MKMHNIATKPFCRVMRRATSALRRFAHDPSGAVSMEFVIILPALLMIFTLIASGSMLLVTSAEVQQVSFELTRGSLRYYQPGIQADALCADLTNELAPSVVKSGDFLQPSRFTNITCNLDAEAALSVTVTYDMTNHPMNVLGSYIGLNIGQFTRTSKMWM